MAEFAKAFEKTMGHEGGYVHDPDDAGGETYRGVARRYHPDWSGWPQIDAAKTNPDFPQSLRTNETLQEAVRSFYKQHFWNSFWGDHQTNQGIAEELFDTSVNMGTHRGVLFLQKALNILNRNQRDYPDMVEDGDYGPTTHRLLATHLQQNKDGYLFKVMNLLQGNHYLNYMKNSPVQEKYARGWLKRVTFEKR